ncbi:MAG: putative PEP-binding protein [Cyanobacteriota bacterium]|nr:putative PEP-binding protein [Cyanobacteriota bacterium]
MDNLLWLGQIQPSERSEVGDKAFDLNEVVRRGNPVAPGFVVSARTLPTWFGVGDWQEPLLADLLDSSFHLNIDDADELQTIAQNIRHEILTAQLPPDWENKLRSAARFDGATTLILRPSVCVDVGSRSGEVPNLSPLLESHLCANQPEELVFALKHTWAELFRARSLFCTQRHNISLKQVRFAVLVQPLGRTIASGVVEANSTHFQIRSTFGGNGAIACTEVVPDSYQIDRMTGRVQTRQLGRKTYAYEGTEIGWASYPLDEERQMQYALSDATLESLIELAQKLTIDLTPHFQSSHFQLEWMFGDLGEFDPESESERPSLWLTRVRPLKKLQDSRPLNISPPVPRQSPSNRSVLSGIAASGGVVVAPAIVIDRAADFPQEIPPSQILVATTISPDWLPQIRQVAGVVTEQGGTTSHGAILARELGIPAVVGVTNATELLQTGEWIQIDGNRAEIDLMSEPPQTDVDRTQPPELGNFADIPIATQLWVNLSQPSSIERAMGLPVDGVGLIRGELMVLETFGDADDLNSQQWGQRQTEAIEKLATSLSQFARSFTPRPIFYRACNREYSIEDDRRSNPALGMQGTFAYQLDSRFFDLELEAISRVRKAGYSNLHLLLPFVRTVEEFEFCRTRAERARLLPDPSFELWIMAEVPSVIFLLPDFVRAGVRGISIGSNDLTQLVLAADRESPGMARVFEARHPAVMRAMQQLVETANDLGIPCSICGDAPVQFPEIVERLVEWGITSISVPPNVVNAAYREIARAERRLLLQASRRQLAEDSGKG